MFETEKEVERVILVAVDDGTNEFDAESCLDELEDLANTADAVVVGRMIQKLGAINRATYLGSGKIDELKAFAEMKDATGIICDDELSPVQIRNLENALNLKVMSRTLVILDIFAKRAMSAEGKVQVELAQLRYNLSHLTGRGKEMSRLGGGIGTRGPGEKKLEVDRRRIADRISDLNKNLKEIERHRSLLRENRNNQTPVIALVGYTNAGKSTLLNIIGGIEKADGGSISIDGELMESMNEKKLSLYRRKHLGYVFQSYNLIPNLTVRENIEVGAYLSSNPLPIDDMIKTLGLWEHQNKTPNQLSGGQQQRTAIGRAIIKNPGILLCDEPTGALDYNTSKEILKLIEDVNKKYGNTVILVTHNDAIKNMADYVIKLKDGQIRKTDINENKIPAMELEW